MQEDNVSIVSRTWKTLADQGEHIYRRLKKRLLENNHGKFVAIDVTSEEYFIGSTLLEAYQKAKKKYPSHKFHFIRIGFSAAVSYKHRIRP